MNARDIIISPVISERSMSGMQEKKYTFKVAKNANKIEIKKAVEECFGVQVEKVTTMNVRGKYRRQGLKGGFTPSWKKAIVKLTADSNTIEFFEGMF